ncbi:MAG TPA: tetratricopeptide repeat protein, partial [Rhodanobacteraceae bacterium]|nr:tetratricopeptide repeat protein [Rhodanobacteraceae bacterium]
TALRREPERRYASVEALAADVQNYLADRPITARADSARYVIGKFIGRHRIGTAAAVVATLILFAALGAALLQAHRARQQAQRAHTAAALAQQQTHRAEAVRQFLVAVFEQTEPDANQGKPLTAHDLLEKGEEQIGRGPHDAALDADASALLADLYEQIGDFDRAQQLLKRALAASEGAALPDDIRARVLIGVAGVEDDNDDYDIAIAHARQGMQLLQDAMPASAELTAKAHNIIAHCLIGKGDGSAAEALLREALAHDVAALGDRNESVAEEWVELGTVLGNAGRYGESETAFQRGIEGWRALFGENSFHVAHALNELSNMLSDKGDFAGAERALRRSLAIRMETVGPRHRDTLIVEHNLLVTLELEGRIAESLPRRLELINRANGSAQMHPPDLGSYYTAAGKDFRDLGRFSEADAMLGRSIAVYDKAYGKASTQSTNPVRARGTTRMLEGRYAEAENDLAGALTILLAHGPPESPQIAAARADLGTLLRLMHKRDDALAMLRQANDAFGKMSSPDRGQIIALAAQSETELDGGDAASARTSAESSLALARKILPSGHFLIATPLFALARAELAARRFAEAEPLLREALSLRAIEPETDPRVLEVKVALVDALEGEGRASSAHALRAEIEAPLRASRTPYAAELRARLATAAAATERVGIR